MGANASTNISHQACSRPQNNTHTAVYANISSTPIIPVPTHPSPLLQISGRMLGEIVLTIKVINCSVRSKGSCPVVRDMPFRSEMCASTMCPNSTRVSFSLELLQDLSSTSWDLECSVKLCFSEVCRWRRYGRWGERGVLLYWLIGHNILLSFIFVSFL